MEATINYMGGVQFEALARGHRVVSDQPPDNRGADHGMTPPEFLLVSLGTCAGYYAAEYLRARSLPAEGLRVRVHAEKALHPARLSSFHIDVEAPGIGDVRHREAILRAVKRCLIHNTLVHSPAVEVSVAEPVTIG